MKIFYKIVIDLDDNFFNIIGDHCHPDYSYLQTVCAFLEGLSLPLLRAADELKDILVYRFPNLNFIIVEE